MDTVVDFFLHGSSSCFDFLEHFFDVLLSVSVRSRKRELRTSKHGVFLTPSWREISSSPSSVVRFPPTPCEYSSDAPSPEIHIHTVA